MNQRTLATVLAVACAAACSAPQTNNSTAVEANALGVAAITIDHHDSNGERLLTVRGLDQDDQQIAVVTLRSGTVLYGADLPEGPSPGTELMISVGDTSHTYVSPDRVAHTIATPSSSALATFVHLRGVAGAIQTEAGIEFSANDGEAAYAAAACSGANFPTNKGNPSECCQDGLQIWHTNPSNSTLANREVLASGAVCRNSAGNTGCVDMGCMYGPCGAAVETVANPNTSAAAVFTPTSAPTQCGRDSNGSSSGGGVEAPEAYSSQTLKGGVTATCPPYTACSATGNPGVHITIEADCDGSGTAGNVTTGTSSVSCTGAQNNSLTVWFPYNTPTSVSAHATTGFFVNWIPGSCSGKGVCGLTETGDGALAEAWFSHCSTGC